MLNYILYRIGEYIALHAPLGFSYRLAEFLSELQYIFSTRDRRSVLDNLRVILPYEKNPQRVAREAFRNFGRYLVEFFRVPKINRKYIEDNIEIIGRENMDAALKKGKGVIGLAAHIGNWELGGIALAILGYPVSAIALPHKDRRVNNFFNSQRRNKGIEVMQLGNAARRCLEALKQKKIVAILGDRDFSQGGYLLDFLSRQKIIPKGPAAFALKTGAPIIFGVMLRRKNNKFRLILEKPIDFSATGDKEKDTLELTKKYAAIIEGYIRKYPEQWLMFRRFWLE